MKSESEQLTEMTNKYFALLEQRKELLTENLNLLQTIGGLLDEQELQPKRDFKYFVYGCLTVSVIVGLVCLLGGA
jgi:hypothetical protein